MTSEPRSGRDSRFEFLRYLFTGLRKFARYKLGFIGFLIVIFFVVLSLFAGFITPFGENQQSYNILQPPSISHPLGTDDLGRDVLSRMIWGAAPSIEFGVGAGLISLLVGIVLGAIPGYFGGLVDDVFSRLFELVLMIPSFFLIILAVAIYGRSIELSMVIVALTIWPSSARITRAQVLTLKSRTYVQAAVVSGAGNFRIISRYILLNGIDPVIANTALQMANAVLIEASLAFLGLGDPNVVSWGLMVYQALQNPTAWWLGISGIAIAILVLGFNLAADGINHALNPRLK
jgi:peptide/nickel transport system permease protein